MLCCSPPLYASNPWRIQPPHHGSSLSCTRRDGSKLNGSQAVIMQDCVNTSVRVVGDVTLQYALFVNNSVAGGAPVLVTPGASLTVVNTVFLGNTGVRGGLSGATLGQDRTLVCFHRLSATD